MSGPLSAHDGRAHSGNPHDGKDPGGASSPQGPTQERSYRSTVLECDAEILEGMLKRADFSIAGKDFTIYCDEPETVGGDNSAPPPMAYLAAAILF